MVHADSESKKDRPKSLQARFKQGFLALFHSAPKEENANKRLSGRVPWNTTHQNKDEIRLPGPTPWATTTAVPIDGPNYGVNSVQ